MPLYLSGTLIDANAVRWSRVVGSGGSGDLTLVMKVDAELFSLLPGLRSTKQGWAVDMSRLPLSLAHENWIPRRGTFTANVSASALGGYSITLTFEDPRGML